MTLLRGRAIGSRRLAISRRNSCVWPLLVRMLYCPHWSPPVVGADSAARSLPCFTRLPASAASTVPSLRVWGCGPRLGSFLLVLDTNAGYFLTPGESVTLTFEGQPREMRTKDGTCLPTHSSIEAKSISILPRRNALGAHERHLRLFHRAYTSCGFLRCSCWLRFIARVKFCRYRFNSTPCRLSTSGPIAEKKKTYFVQNIVRSLGLLAVLKSL
jgi:hypothetical protein